VEDNNLAELTLLFGLEASSLAEVAYILQPEELGHRYWRFY